MCYILNNYSLFCHSFTCVKIEIVDKIDKNQEEELVED